MGTETTEKKRRINLLKVPVDIIPPQQLGEFFIELLSDEKEHNIVLLSLWDLLRARRNSDYRTYIQQASLVIPISKSIISGLKFLTGEKAYRYMPFDFIISILANLEKREHSCYLLGGEKKVLSKTENNIRQTFPRLRIVGRYPGSFKKAEEATLIKAIKKASPSLLLVGKGIRGGENWISKNSENLGKGLRLWCSDIFDVFAEKKKHPSSGVFNSGLEWVGYYFHAPYKFLRIFPYLYYKIVLLIYKLFIKDH